VVVKSKKCSLADFAMVDDADGNLVEVPVRVEYCFVPGEKATSYLSSDGGGDPGEAPSIEDFGCSSPMAAT